MRLARILLVGVLTLIGLGGVDDQLAPEQRAEALLARMTHAEQLTLMHGGAACGYVGCVDGIERLGIPPLRLQDGPTGVGGGFTGVTQLPATVAAAAAWDPAVMTAYGQVLGAEAWAKGVGVMLAPTVNIVRDPRWGRAFESLGEDPYLAGRSAAAEIAAIRAEGPMAQVKHYAVYNQETGRNSLSADARVDERTLREIYLPAFEDAIRAGVDSVMCGYNPVNGVFPCENGQLQQTILRDQLGFRGFITSDWDATHSGPASAEGGLDMEMPDAEYFGTLDADVTVHARRILTAMFRQGLFDHPPTGTPTAAATSDAHTVIARQVAEQGSVLLKNDGPVLPIGAGVHSIAVLGNAGGETVLSQGGGSARVDPDRVISPYQGLKEHGGAVTYEPGTARADGALPAVDAGPLQATFYAGTALSGPPLGTRTEDTLNGDWRGGDPGTGVPSNWSARWTGTITPPDTGTYTFSLTSTDGARFFVDGKLIIDNGWAEHPTRTRTATVSLVAGRPATVRVENAHFAGNAVLTLGWTRPGRHLHDDAVRAARKADLAVVVVGRFSAEGSDLPGLDLSADQNKLVTDVVAVNPNTVVVLNTGSAITMPWADKVPAIIESWYPGQEYGHALARLLHGDVNFSGKLPVTFPRTPQDTPAASPARFPGGAYTEKLEVGYRWYDAQKKDPLFPFGHGLSYTTFAYENLTVAAPAADGTVQVAWTLTNTGPVAGAEISQVYVEQPPAAGEPPRNLRAFTKTPLAPGRSQRVTTTLDARSFQTWTNGTWVTTPGPHTIAVGASSRDLRLKN